MSETILTYFQQWFEKHQHSLEAAGITVTISAPALTTDNPGQHMQVDTGNRVARVTLWASGACDLEALDVESDKPVFWEHQEIKRVPELDQVLDAFVERVRSGAP